MEIDTQVQEKITADTNSQINEEGKQEQPLFSSEQEKSSPEIDKMKAVIRQLFRDKEKLKKDIEIECKKRDDDVNRIYKEMNMIKLDIKRLNEEKDLTQLPSPEEDAKIKSLAKQLSDFEISLKSIRSNTTVLNQENSIIQKEVDQYKMTISTLEENLFSCEEDKAQYLNLQSKLFKLEDEKREKQRMIDELIISERLSAYELQKMKNKINLIKTGKPIILNIERQNPIYIYQPVSQIPSAVLSVYKDLNIFDLNGNDDNNEKEEEDKINDFILSFPRRIQILEEENQRFNEQCAELQKKYQKLKSMQKNDTTNSKNESQSIVDESKVREESLKMTEIAKKLLESNKAKAQKLKELKELADQQHASLQRLVGIPKSNESIILSLKQVLNQLENCDQADHNNLCDIGEKLLDAMVGIGSDIQ